MTRAELTSDPVGVGLHQIGEVASLVGLSLRAIRYYEDVGVVVPTQRSPGGFRLYGDRDIDRLRKVMGMKPMGFTLEEIHDLLDLLDAAEDGVGSPEVWEQLQMYATLAVERLGKQRRKLELGVEFTAQLHEICERTVVGEDRFREPVSVLRSGLLPEGRPQA